MGTLWTIARGLGDLLYAPFGWMPPLAGLITLSVVCGVVLLLAFRVLTPQERLKRVKDLMSSTIYEMRLYSAYPVHVLKAQGRAIVLTVRYLLLAMPSFVVLLPVVGVLLLRAALVYEVQPLQVGERAMLSVSLRAGEAQAVTVEAVGDGVKVVRPLVHLHGGVYARVEGIKLGQHLIRVRVGQATEDKTVTVGGDAGASPVRSLASSWELLLGSEAPLAADGPVTGITVAYREEGMSWFGLPWWLHLLIISMVVALALRRRLGVVF